MRVRARATSNVRKQCVKPCVDRGSFLENANLFRRGSRTRVDTSRNELLFITTPVFGAFDRFLNGVHSVLRVLRGANIAFTSKHLACSRVRRKYVRARENFGCSSHNLKSIIDRGIDNITYYVKKGNLTSNLESR